MIDLGLARVFRLLARTPLPWRAIHVAGTNGKGSICAYVTAMLNHYNQSDHLQDHKPLKHGRFTSPHLIDHWDCITINGETISETIFRNVEEAIHRRNQEEDIRASEFELLTATAFEIFTQENIDIGVIEVGLGGRLDATNVLGQRSEYDTPSPSQDQRDEATNPFRPLPLVTAISSISLDHQSFLGTTLPEIAYQKAGILKPTVPVIASAEDLSVNQVISTQATTINCPRISWTTSATTPSDIYLRHRLPTDPINPPNDLPKAFYAPVQSRWSNGAIALEAVYQSLFQLKRLSSLSPAQKITLLTSLSQIPARTLWPGRLQEINLESLTGYTDPVILDGAHNAQAAHVLDEYVRLRARTRGVHWVLAASQGKDVKGLGEILIKCGDAISTVEFGPVDGMPWVKSVRSTVMLDAFATGLIADRHAYGEDLMAALREASELAKERDCLLVIAGSLYLVGDVLRLLRRKHSQN